MMKKVGFIQVYNKIAPVYDKWFGKSCQDSYALILDRIQAYNITFKNVLDIGCGTGQLLETLSNATCVKELYGIDPAENMIQVAKNKQLAKCKFFVGFAENLPFADKSVDCVVSTAAFSHYSDVKSVLCEVHRILKPTGHCIIVDHKKPNFFIKTILATIKLLANYLDTNEIKNIISKENFEIRELKETKKYFIVHIVPVLSN